MIQILEWLAGIVRDDEFVPQHRGRCGRFSMDMVSVTEMDVR
ncbi:hypothetical protein [Paenibacillus dendrobii]|nr:hypothetical protein [Paenibacillus dendrobii]